MISMVVWRLALPVCFCVVTAGLQAQTPPPRPKVVDAAAPAVALRPGRTSPAALTVTVARGFKVQANPPTEGLVATTLMMAPSEGLHFGAPQYPKSKVFALEGVGDLLVYDGIFTITLPISASRSAAPGPRTLEGTLRYQACDDTTCLLPISLPVRIEVTVAAISQKRER